MSSSTAPLARARFAAELFRAADDQRICQRVRLMIEHRR